MEVGPQPFEGRFRTTFRAESDILRTRAEVHFSTFLWLMLNENLLRPWAFFLPGSIRSDQNQKRCVNIRGSMVCGSIVDSDYYISPPGKTYRYGSI